MVAHTNAIAVAISPALKAHYNTPENYSLFNDDVLGVTGDYLFLYGNYSSQVGVSDNLIQSVALSIKQRKIEPYRFSLEVIDGRERALDVIETIILELEETGQVTVLDFFQTINENVRYVARQGILNIEERPNSFYSEKFKQNLFINKLVLEFTESLGVLI